MDYIIMGKSAIFIMIILLIFAFVFIKTEKQKNKYKYDNDEAELELYDVSLDEVKKAYKRLKAQGVEPVIFVKIYSRK